MKTSVMQEFCRLAANRNYSRTAEELYITQSALSRHVAALEEELNAKLIDRSRNAFSLTPSGEMALEAFSKILSDYETLLERLQADVGEGSLDVGVLYYDMDFYVAKIRKRFHEKHPSVQSNLHSYQPARLEKDLLDGKIDCAIIYDPLVDHHQAIEYMPFLKIPYYVIFNEKHHLNQMEKLSLDDLKGEKMLYPRDKYKIAFFCGKTLDIMESDTSRESILFSNFDEVPWLLQETGGIYVSPMVNPGAYGSSTRYRYFCPDQYSCEVGAAWLTENQNPAIRLFLSTIKMCYP